MLSRNEILALFMQPTNCAQVVAGEMAETLSYDKDQAMRAATPFGAGMYLGDTCGAVTGALMAIGLKYGHSKPGSTTQDLICREKTAEFQKHFSARHGSTICREILGYDCGKAGEMEKAQLSGKTEELCPGFVQSALEILEEMLDDE